MKFKQYQVDAFASKVFAGNPAAVCPLQQWLSDELMQIYLRTDAINKQCDK